MVSSAPLNINTTQLRWGLLSCDITRRTSSIKLQLTASSLAPEHMFNSQSPPTVDQPINQTIKS